MKYQILLESGGDYHRNYRADPAPTKEFMCNEDDAEFLFRFFYKQRDILKEQGFIEIIHNEYIKYKGWKRIAQYDI